jgi:hypothetical protein
VVAAPDALREILGAQLRVHGVTVGHVTGVLLDAPQVHAIGFEVSSPDGAQRFVPWVAATLGNGVVDAHSALLLVDSCDSYVDQGAVLCREPDDLDGLMVSESGKVSSSTNAPAELLSGARR